MKIFSIGITLNGTRGNQGFFDDPVPLTRELLQRSFRNIGKIQIGDTVTVTIHVGTDGVHVSWTFVPKKRFTGTAIELCFLSLVRGMAELDKAAAK